MIISDENVASLKIAKTLGFQKRSDFEQVGKRSRKVMETFGEKEKIVSHGYTLEKCRLDKYKV